jgi:hypothetical protein
LGVVKKTLAEWCREPSTEGLRYQLIHMRDILERWKVRVNKLTLSLHLDIHNQSGHFLLQFY